MRNGMKKLISAVLATMTAATVALTAFAADYAEPPVFNSNPSETVAVTTTELKDAVNNASEGNVTVTTKSVKTLTVGASVMKALDKADAVLEIVSPKATVTIDAATITKTRKLDLSMKTYSSAKRAVVKFRGKKDFGCEVVITLTKCRMSAEKLANAHVYCDGEDLGPVELDENGNPIIKCTKGGTYEIK